MIKSLSYSIKQSFIQIFRNRGMSLASVFSITAMLLILSVVLSLSVNISFLTESVKTQFDTIEVFLDDGASQAQTDNIMKSLKARDEVADVEYIDKAKALEEFRNRWGDSAYLLDGLASNPLPNSIRVKLADLKYGNAVKSVCQKFSGVEDVRYYADEVTKVLDITNVIQKGALVVIIFLIFVSVVVVSNTVKLTVMARQEEISIMKCVGATNWFIRGPLLCEGMIIGLISSIVAILISSGVYYKLAELFNSQAISLFAAGLVDPIFLIENFIWIFVALGVSIGAFGSIISMRKFLKV